MPHYFIIDRARIMQRIEAGDKSQAVDSHNDSHKIKADMIMEAAPCVHGRFIVPPLPDWLHYSPTSNCKTCFECSTGNKSVSQEDNTTLFRHEKLSSI